MRRITNSLRQEALNLNKEINFLNYEVNELQTEIDIMERGNNKIKSITNLQDSHIDKLVDLVEENLDIMDAMRVSCCQKVVNSIISTLSSLQMLVLPLTRSTCDKLSCRISSKTFFAAMKIGMGC